MNILRCKRMAMFVTVFITLLSIAYEPYTVGNIKADNIDETVYNESYDKIDTIRNNNFIETAKIQTEIEKQNQLQIETQSRLVACSGMSRGGSRDIVKYKIIQKISQRDAEFNDFKTDEEKNDIAETIISEANSYQLNPLLVASVIDVESKFRTDAKSKFGATGLMQLIPSTARFVAEDMGLSSYDLTDYKDNIKMGTYYYAVHCVGAWSHNNITQVNPDTGELFSAYFMGLMTYNGNTRNARSLSNIEYAYSVEYVLYNF